MDNCWNEMPGRILETFKGLEQCPESGGIPEWLCEINLRVSAAAESYMTMRKYGFPLIHGTCAISENDCKYWNKCQAELEERKTACEPEGLAFRLADVILITMAMMQELNLDIRKVVSAEYRYLEAESRRNA